MFICYWHALHISCTPIGTQSCTRSVIGWGIWQRPPSTSISPMYYTFIMQTVGRLSLSAYVRTYCEPDRFIARTQAPRSFSAHWVRFACWVASIPQYNNDILAKINVVHFKVCHPCCVCNSLGGRRVVKTTQLIRKKVYILMCINYMFRPTVAIIRFITDLRGSHISGWGYW